MKIGKFIKVYLLNLPDKEHQAAKEADLRARYSQPASASDGLDAWAQASQRATSQKAATSTQLWSAAAEPKKQKYWIRLVRGLLVTVLVLAVITGVRSWIWPDRGPAAEPIPAAVAFPSSEATGLAERFAAAYLSWDETNVEARGNSLSQMVAGGNAGSMGWNGKGKQTVSNVHAGGVEAITDAEGRVSVTAMITPHTLEKDQWVAQEQKDVALEVKIQILDGRAVVAGRPGFVAMPSPTAIPEVILPVEDTELADATKTNAEQFFTAYGAETDVSALTAPSAEIPGLGGALTFSKLSSWAVYEAVGDMHEATAVVEWISGSSLIEQTYKLTLVKVTGAGANRWQISSLSGGDY